MVEEEVNGMYWEVYHFINISCRNRLTPMELFCFVFTPFHAKLSIHGTPLVVLWLSH